MPLANVVHLYRARLKARAVLVQEALAILGIAVGIALLFGAQIASTSLNDSVNQFTNGVIGNAAAYQLAARSPVGFSEKLLDRVQRLPGVAHAIPVLEQEALLIGPRGSADVDLLAGDPRYARLAGPLLSHFSSPHLAKQEAVALPDAIAKQVGAQTFEAASVVINGLRSQVTVAAELSEANVGQLAHSPVAIAPLAYAQKLSGLRGRLTQVFVQPAAGDNAEVRAELVRLAKSRLNVQPADFAATLFGDAAAPVNQSTSTFALVCALVGFMFAYCSMLLTVDLRRGLINELRRCGASRWEAIKVLLFDALVLGVIASVAGLAIGDLLSLLLFGSNPGYLSFAFPIGAQRIITWQSAVISVVVAMLAAGIGVLTPMRDIWSRAHAHRRPWLSAPAAIGWTSVGMLLGGLACLAGTALILLLAPQSAVVGVIVLVLAMLLLLPLAADAATAAFAALHHALGRGATGIAITELRNTKMQARSIAIAATTGIAVFANVTIQGSHANLQRGLGRLTGQLSGVANIWVLQPGQRNTLATTPFSDAYAASIRKAPGVRSVGTYRAGFLDIGDRRTWVLAPPSNAAGAIPPSQIIAGNLQTATARLRSGGWVVLSQVLARERHLHLGSRFTLPSADPVTLRVAATISNLGWPPGAIILSSGDFVRAWGTSNPTAYNVTLSRGASPTHVAAAIRRALGPDAGLSVQTGQQRATTQIEVSKRGLSRLTQIAILVLIAGMLATVVSMGGAIWQRRQRYARLKREGIDTGTLWAALILESLLLIGCGCLAGAVAGVFGQLLLSHALIAVTGFPVIISLAIPLAISSFALVTAVAAAMIGIPGYQVASVPPSASGFATRV
jgi:putative ABC transport system permease protein